MASSADQGAASAASVASTAPKQPRKPAQRIVPAIPYALTRRPASQRPATPANTAPDPVTEPPQPHRPGDAPEKLLNGPPTPQSRASASTNDRAASTNGRAASLVPASTTGSTLDTEQSTSSQPRRAIEAKSAAPHPEAHTPVVAFPAAHGGPAVPSVGGIVFGNVHDSPAVPSPSLEPELKTGTSGPPAPRSPPGFGPPPFAPPFHPGHSHHPADHQAPWANPIRGGGRPDESLRHVVDQSLPHHGHHANIDSASSHSQSSPFNPNSSDTRDSSEHGADSYRVPHRSGPGGPALPNPGPQPQSFAPPKFNPPVEVIDWLSMQFGRPEFSDFFLRLHGNDRVLLGIPVHGIVVARSPTIATAMRRLAHAKNQPKPTMDIAIRDPFIDIVVRDPFITPRSLNEALKVLYGIPFPPIDSMFYNFGPSYFEGVHNSQTRMSEAISYAAAAKFFHIYSMHGYAIELIQAVLRWDTVDMAISYVLGGGGPTAGSMPGQVGYQLGQLLDRLLDFMVRDFPAHFRLDRTAPELRYAPRLPNVADRPTHTSRLSQIRFGSVPTEDDNADYITRTISSILLSIPLHLLDRFYNQLASHHGWDVYNLMDDVVNEREFRREKVLSDGRSRLSDMDISQMPKQLLENMLCAERIVPSTNYPSGYTLAHTRIAGTA